jgi:tripartite-type tricarboxylate transporter receptor subunit TctC
MRVRMMLKGLTAAMLGAILPMATQDRPVSAQSVEQFYKAKNPILIVGTDASGEYAVGGRLLAKHIQRHLPGAPPVIVQFMPGASSIKSANYMYTAAPKDGSVVSLPNKGIAMFEAAKMENTNYKSADFNWIGNMTRSNNLAVVWHTKGVKTLEDATKTEVIVGALGAGGTLATYPAILNAVTGTKFKVVLGYAGAQLIDLAMERGEVDGRASYSWSDLKRVRSEWLKEGKLNILVQFGLEKEPDLPDVPLIVDLARNEQERKILSFVAADNNMARPFYMPPKVPADRVAAFRKAFDDTMTDQEFLEDAKKVGVTVTPLSGARLEDLVKNIVNAPPEVINGAEQWMTKN